MINSKMIEIIQDLDSIDYDTGIEIKINPDNFDYPSNFVKLTSSQFDSIMLSDSSINKENLLIAFLYINSYIGCRSKNDDGTEKMFNPETCPEAFFKTIKSMSEDLSMSKDTINQCLDVLTTSTSETQNNALLIKKEVGYIPQDKNLPPKNAPNIYVLNKKGYEQEIEWALKKMLEIYKVDKFIKRE